MLQTLKMRHISEYQKKNKIAMVFFDFDGVFTDNNVTIDEYGNELVRCSRYDGFGLEALKKQSIKMAVLTTETKPLARLRCKKLSIDVYDSVSSKLETAISVLRGSNIVLENCCFVGNDINDLELLKKVAFPIVTPDCHPSLSIYDFFSTSLCGGKGCVREVCDFLTS